MTELTHFKERPVAGSPELVTVTCVMHSDDLRSLLAEEECMGSIRPTLLWTEGVYRASTSALGLDTALDDGIVCRQY